MNNNEIFRLDNLDNKTKNIKELIRFNIDFGENKIDLDLNHKLNGRGLYLGNNKEKLTEIISNKRKVKALIYRNTKNRLIVDEKLINDFVKKIDNYIYG